MRFKRSFDTSCCCWHFAESPSQLIQFNVTMQTQNNLHDKIETGDLNNISGTSKWLAEEGEGRGHEKNGCTYQLIK